MDLPRLWSQDMELLAELVARGFQGGGAVGPVGPAGGDGQHDGVEERGLPEVLEDVRVLVILNAVANRFETNAGSRFGRGDRRGRIHKDAVAGSRETAAVEHIHVVPAAESISSGPIIGAVVEDAGGPLRPIQEAGLDALIDG